MGDNKPISQAGGKTSGVTEVPRRYYIAMSGEKTRIAVIGEVLWDVFPDSTRLGGAPLNFAAHARRLGHEPLLVSAVGNDKLGAEALARIAALGLDTTMIDVSRHLETGTARVDLGDGEHPAFTIVRPAAYDDVRLTGERLERMAAWAPAAVYYGTLFASREEGRATLLQLLDAIPHARRFYDINLRPGSDSPALVGELLGRAGVVKLNETELEVVARSTGLPSEAQGFCRAGASRYGWTAACVTFGSRGCAVLAGGEYAEAPGCPVEVADPVGAGDAFAAAFLHGLEEGWRAEEIARFANRLGALVASRPGAIPEWSLAEIAG
jgi:fructokinase